MPILADCELRALTLPESRGLRALGLALGKGQNALEVVLTEGAWFDETFEYLRQAGVRFLPTDGV
jgi:hypothetical protein